MVKSNRLAADLLWTKRRRAEETEELAVRLQSYIPQGAAIIKACATVAPAWVVCPFLPSPFALRTYIYIYIHIYIHSKISNRTQSSSLASLTLAARQLYCMFVNGSKLLEPNLAALSLATVSICTVLLWLIMQQVCATETVWLQTHNGQLQHNSRASHSC